MSKKINYTTMKEHKEMYGTKKACAIKLLEARTPSRNCSICNEPVDENYKLINRSDSFRCKKCGNHFYVKAESFLDHCHMPLVDIFENMFLDLASRNGIAVLELERLTGYSYTTIERLKIKVREQMGKVLDEIHFKNTYVEVDETYVRTGTKGAGRHVHEDIGRRGFFKTPVFGIVERNGAAKLFVVKNCEKDTLTRIIEKHIHKSTVIYTDELNSYNGLNDLGYLHFSINHEQKEWVKKETFSGTMVTTNTIEGLFSILKKILRSTYGSTGPNQLQSLLNEIAFKYTFRNHPDYGFEMLLKAMPAFTLTYPPAKVA